MTAHPCTRLPFYKPSEPFWAATATQKSFNGMWEGLLTWRIAVLAILTTPPPCTYTTEIKQEMRAKIPGVCRWLMTGKCDWDSGRNYALPSARWLLAVLVLGGRGETFSFAILLA